VMITAIAVVHLPAFYQLSLLAMTLSLIVSGGGQLSIDRLFGAQLNNLKPRSQPS
jgi:uncharacterized membrane protein YphA (DoxX/SURF4 family)